MDNLQLIIRAINAARISQGTNKRTFAASCDITPQYFELIIQGKSTPSAAILIKMAQNAGFSLALCVDLQKFNT